MPTAILAKALQFCLVLLLLIFFVTKMTKFSNCGSYSKKNRDQSLKNMKDVLESKKYSEKAVEHDFCMAYSVISYLDLSNDTKI